MSFICPLCNGMEMWNTLCPECGAIAEDRGRLTDLFGPYSPYRPIDELKMTDGHMDLKTHRCIHVSHCAHCGSTSLVPVEERNVNDTV